LDAYGDLITLNEQDRSLWDQQQIREGCKLVIQTLRTQRFVSFTLQAAIASVYADPPIVRLNQAMAIAMLHGPEAGLGTIKQLLAEGELNNYHLIHATKADLCRRLQQFAAARMAYQQALSLTQQGPEQRFLQRRLAELPI